MSVLGKLTAVQSLLAAAIVGLATMSPACEQPEEWDYLPQVEMLSFSKTLVGLTSVHQGQYILDGSPYILERSTGRLTEVSREEFEREFAGAPGVRAVVKDQISLEEKVTLKTSIGKDLSTMDAYSGEGERKHELWMDGRMIKDQVQPLTSVSSAEIIGNQLWLGTRLDQECATSPAEGIVVQTLDKGQLVKTLTTRQGLTGDLIRAVRLDPLDKTVWIATHEGINVVDQEFRVRKSFYFYDDLDRETGLPRMSLSPTKRRSSILATLFRQLRVADAAKYRVAVKSITAATEERFRQAFYWDSYFMAGDPEHAFAPKEMNVLVPFFIEAAGSADPETQWFAWRSLCFFDDQRVVDFVNQHRQPPPMHSLKRRMPEDRVQYCVRRLTRFGRAGAGQRTEGPK